MRSDISRKTLKLFIPKRSFGLSLMVRVVDLPHDMTLNIVGRGGKTVPDRPRQVCSEIGAFVDTDAQR